MKLLILYTIITCAIGFLYAHNEKCKFTYPNLTLILITILSPLLLPYKIYITHKNNKNE